MQETKEKLSLQEMLGEDILYSAENGPIMHIAVETGTKALELVEWIGKRLLDRPQLIKLVNARTVEEVTKDLLAYLNDALHDPKCVTTEQKLAKVGATAYSTLLAYHITSHYLIGQLAGKNTIDMNDTQLKQYILSKCQMLPFCFELLAKHIPESVSAPKAPEYDVKTVN